MDIKEIAKSLKIKMQDPDDGRFDIGEFAEALVSEIQRRGEPVAFYAYQREVHYLGTRLDILKKQYPHVANWNQLFTFPPSIEALEDKVAEACAAYINRKVGVLEDVDKAVSALRSGEWKKFRKGE